VVKKAVGIKTKPAAFFMFQYIIFEKGENNMLGTQVRLERMMDRNTKKTVIVPLVHGVGMGPLEGIKDIANTVDVVSLAGANAIILNKGIVERAHRRRGKDIGLIIHLTGSYGGSDQVQVCTVEEALRIGADAVRMTIPVSHSYNGQNGNMLKSLGEITKTASYWGMPLLAMVVVGENGQATQEELELMIRGARIGAEIGADIISMPYPGSLEGVRDVVNSVPAPIIVMGGGKVENEREILELVKNSLQAGAMGVSVGRNVFQHSKPGNMIKAISSIVHNGASVAQAAKILTEKPLESPVYSQPIW
jgi:class I fructose-bisphosphate aldolase